MRFFKEPGSKLGAWYEEFIRPDDQLLFRRTFREHISRYHFALPYLANKLVLDVASGSGYGAAYLASKGSVRVVGGDASEEAVRLAQRHFHREDVEFSLLDATALPFQDGVFDAVVSIETIEHLVGPKDFLREITRVLRPEGILVLSTPNKDALFAGSEEPRWPFHVKEFRLEELRSLLIQFFSQVQLYGLGQCRPGMRVQTRRWVGWSATVKVLLMGILRSLPASHILLKLVTRFCMEDFTPVDMRIPENFDIAAGQLETGHLMDSDQFRDAPPRDIVAVAGCPKKQGGGESN